MEVQKILLVDDDDINLFVADKVLSKANFSVTKANSGLKAIELAENEKFDAILMDINMPEMNGIETTHIIRKQDSLNASTPVFALTAHNESEAERIANENNLSGYLKKPIELKEIEEKLSALASN